METDLDKIFDGCPNTSEVSTFTNEKYCGLEIQWSQKGHGFGQLLISFNRKKGTWRADTERCSHEELTDILEMAAPKMAQAMLNLDSHSIKGE